MHRLIYASEQHQSKALSVHDALKPLFQDIEYSRVFKVEAERPCCFKISHNQGKFAIDTSYYVGVDWVIKDKASIYIQSKLDEDNTQVDVLGMLMESLEAPENLEHLESLFEVDYDTSWIPVPQEKDLLSPFLIVQFLKLLQHIVKKGLKKSYYTVQENLANRVKGKILVGRQLKENIFKNRQTNTVCEYQEFGVNCEENRFLKTVLSFVKAYVYQSETYFTSKQKLVLTQMLNFCEPAFHNVESLKNKHKEVKARRNIFFKDYEEAIRIGHYILKRFSYNISKVSTTASVTPPFWIDMSKLFELYVYRKLKDLFSTVDAVSYHDKYSGGKETDILIKTDGYKAIVDCKYKSQYKDHNPSLEDKRQLAGYTRLKSVYKKLKIPYNEVVDGIIVYSHQESPNYLLKEDLHRKRIEEYISFYKVGISLPVVK